jgi:hypothetical protein
MARSTHAQYNAAERFERKASRKPRPTERRVTTRRAVIRAALQEVSA